MNLVQRDLTFRVPAMGKSYGSFIDPIEHAFIGSLNGSQRPLLDHGAVVVGPEFGKRGADRMVERLEKLY